MENVLQSGNETNFPLISIVVPVYNVEKYLDECVQSILCQTYTALEIILVDDGSTDAGGKICDEYALKDSRIKVIHKTNGGLSDARNAGINIAAGKYITFIDSDDFITPDYVSYLYNLCKEYNTKISVSAHTIYLENGNKIYKGLYSTKKLSAKEALTSILLDNGVDLSAWAKLYEKNLFTDINFPVGKNFEDTATTYKLFDKCDNIACGKEANYFYRIRKNSITTSISSDNFYKKLQLITNTEEMCNYIENKYPELHNACERRKIWAYFSTLNQLNKITNKKSLESEENKIVQYLKERRKIILTGKEYSRRDKLAIQCLSFGNKFYSFAWKFYEKIIGK